MSWKLKNIHVYNTFLTSRLPASPAPLQSDAGQCCVWNKTTTLQDLTVQVEEAEVTRDMGQCRLSDRTLWDYRRTKGAPWGGAKEDVLMENVLQQFLYQGQCLVHGRK